MRMNRREFLAATTAVSAVSLIVRPAMAGVTLNLSDVLPESNFQVQNAKRFAEAVQKATAGEVAISVKAGGSLGFKGPEQMRAVRDGLVPMADILTAQQIGDEPLFGTEGVPFLVGSPAELKALHRFLRPEFDKLAAKYNQKILYMVPSPAQYIFTKIKVSSVDQLRGVKVRGADKHTVDTTNAIGMAGVMIPWGELIPALASGRVEGVATSATSGVDGKFWEFLKYVYPTNHTWSTNMVNINLDSWKKISPAHQKAIVDLAVSLEPEFWTVSTDGDKESIKKLAENSMELVPVSPAMAAQMRAMAAPLTDAFIQRVPAAGPIIQEYRRALGRA